LSLIRANPDRFERLAQAKVLDGHESWGPPALVEGRLIVRDLTTMVCVDVSEK
jgi:outer membrane protein assembly factor BamB